jgi:hypothetical protein
MEAGPPELARYRNSVEALHRYLWESAKGQAWELAREPVQQQRQESRAYSTGNIPRQPRRRELRSS